MKKVIMGIGLLTAAGCGGGGPTSGVGPGSPPAISALQYSPSYVLQGITGSTSIISGSVAVTDPDGDVTKILIQGNDIQSGASAPIVSDVSSTKGQVSFTGRANSTIHSDNAGTYNFTVSAIDSGGRASNKLNGIITIVPDPNFAFDGVAATSSNTGLTWPLNALLPGPYTCTSTGPFQTWLGAGQYVSCLNNNNWLSYSNWRLPTKGELSAMGVYASDKPINLLGDINGFHGLSANVPYWSKDEVSSGGRDAWAVYLYRTNDNGQTSDDKNSNYHLIWPVRDNR